MLNTLSVSVFMRRIKPSLSGRRKDEVQLFDLKGTLIVVGETKIKAYFFNCVKLTETKKITVCVLYRNVQLYIVYTCVYTYTKRHKHTQCTVVVV